jgi:hypothetical protein
MNIPQPYSIKEVQVGLVLGMTRYNYHIMYDDQSIMTLFAPGVAKTVCDAMNVAYRVGYIDGANDLALQRRLSQS